MDIHDRSDPPAGDAPDDSLHSVRLDADEPVATSVVHAVASALGRQPLDLEPLSTQVDPEALETLLGGPIGEREGLTVSFRFAGCTVAVTPTRIDVLSTPDSTDAE
jgi:hypothetical protein